MIDKSALDYIRAQLKSGLNKEIVSKTLAGAGWQPDDIAEAFSEIEKPAAPTPAPTPTPAPVPKPVAPLMPAPAAQPVPAQAPVQRTPLPEPMMPPVIKPSAPATPAQVPVQAPVSVPASVVASANRSHLLRNALAGVGVLVLLLAGTVGYAFAAQKIAFLPQLPFGFPFLSKAPYDSAHLLQQIALGLTRISEASFDAKVSVAAEPRDEGVTPLSLGSANDRTLETLATRIPTEFKLELSFGGAAEKGSDTNNARITASGSLQSTDFSMEAALEARKVGDTVYILISKFPSVFFDISAIRDKWIVVTPDDQKSYGGRTGLSMALASTSPEDQAKARERIVNLLGLADRHGVFVLSGDPERVTVDGAAAYRYTLALAPSQIAPFYEEALATYGDDPLYGLRQDALDYMQSDDGKLLLDYLGKSMTFDVWADETGIPHEMRLSLRLVPGDDIVRMKDKQVRVTFDLRLNDINMPVTVATPEPTIPLEEAERLVFGPALSNSRMNARDARRVADIRQLQLALELYNNDNNKYPSSLQALVPSYLPTQPQDPTDKVPYLYTLRSAGSYTLKADLEAKNPSLKNVSSSGCSQEPDRYCYTVTP